MKKLTFIAAFFLTVSTVISQTTTATPNNGVGTSNTPNDPATPNSITNRFNTDYPNTNPTWSREGSNYRADYWQGTMGRSITYDMNGNMISRNEQLSSGSFPSGISDYYSKKHPNEQFDVWSSTDANGNLTYYTNRNSEVYWFDKSGKYTRSSKSKTKSQVPEQKAGTRTEK